MRNLTGYHDIIGRKRASDVNAAFLDWLPRRKQRPFFAFLNYYDAHEPYLPPAPFDTLFGPAGPRRLAGTQQRMRLAFPPDRETMSTAEVAAEQRAYDASIAYLDSELGRLFDALTSRGLLDNTIVIVTSDHGEQFGEHGLHAHGNSLYAQATRVPLLVSFPARLAPRVVDSPVTLADLPATVLALAGFPDHASFPGRSILDGTGSVVTGDVEPLPSSVTFPKLRGRLRSLTIDTLHWLLNADGSEELYRFRTDSAEQVDLTGAGHAGLRAQLRAQLDSIVPATPTRRPGSGPDR